LSTFIHQDIKIRGTFGAAVKIVSHDLAIRFYYDVWKLEILQPEKGINKRPCGHASASLGVGKPLKVEELGLMKLPLLSLKHIAMPKDFASWKSADQCCISWIHLEEGSNSCHDKFLEITACAWTSRWHYFSIQNIAATLKWMQLLTGLNFHPKALHSLTSRYTIIRS